MEEDTAAGERETVMVVDDDAAIIYMLEMMLDSLGYTVDAYSRSTDAAAAFSANPQRYDLLMTDLAMPRMSGGQLAEHVQEVRPGFPIIMLTGYAEDSFSREARQRLSVKRVLIKPVSIDTLAVELRAVLDAR